MLYRFWALLLLAQAANLHRLLSQSCCFVVVCVLEWLFEPPVCILHVVAAWLVVCCFVFCVWFGSMALRPKALPDGWLDFLFVVVWSVLKRGGRVRAAAGILPAAYCEPLPTEP